MLMNVVVIFPSIIIQYQLLRPGSQYPCTTTCPVSHSGGKSFKTNKSHSLPPIIHISVYLYYISCVGKYCLKNECTMNNIYDIHYKEAGQTEE